MKIWIFLSGVIVLMGMLSCSSRDTDRDTAAQEYLATHPHPFELRATDSSIIAKNLWEDTLMEYSLNIWRLDEEGIPYVPDATIFPPLVRGGDSEWTFSSLGVDKLMNEDRLQFHYPSDTAHEFGIGWEYVEGTFKPYVWMQQPMELSPMMRVIF
jgi:hypothetical protein